MNRLEIRKVELIERLTKDGKTYFKQPAYLHTPDEPYPVAVLLYVKNRNEAHQPGIYDLSVRAYSDRFKSLSFRYDLTPSKAKRLETA